MRGSAAIAAVFVLLGASYARGQAEPSGTPPGTTAPATVAPEAEGESWAFSVSAWRYYLPEDQDYVQPTFIADHGWLHLEGRYNYEAQDTGSAWMGYNFAGGDKLSWEVTAMLGAVFGDLEGIAPGYEGYLSWWKLELYSEGEYVIADDSSESFLYNWSELTIAPLDWFRFGLATQRTRAYEEDRDVQRGLVAGFSFKQAYMTAYVLNPDDSDPIFILALGLDF